MLYWLKSKIDIVLALACLLFGAYSVLQTGIDFPGTVVSAVILFSLLYLLLRGRINVNQSLPSLKASSNIRKINQIVFILSLCANIWILHDNLYFRPILYFGVCLITAASIIWETFYSADSRTSQALILFKMIILGIIIRAGIYYGFSGIFGADPWIHNQVVQQTISSGNVVDYVRGAILYNNSYSHFPIFHITAAITQIVTSLSIYDSIFTSIGFFETFSCVFIFLTARKTIGIKAGLLSALLFCLCDSCISWGTSIIPMSLGIGFVAMLLYLIMAESVKRRASIFIIMLLISSALILTQSAAGFIMLVILIAILIGTILSKRLAKDDTKREAVVSPTFVILFFVLLGFWWMQPQVAGTSILESLLLRFKGAFEYTPLMSGVAASVFSLTTIFNELGYALMTGLSLITCLAYLHSPNHFSSRITVVTVIAAMFMASLASTGVKEALIADRWRVFQYMLLSILAVIGIAGLFSFIKNSRGKSVVMFLVILLILFPLITDSRSNSDSPLFGYDVNRVAYTESELTAIKTLSPVLRSEPITDVHFAEVLTNIISPEEYADMRSGGRDDKVFILRKYSLFHSDYNDAYRIQVARVNREYLFEGKQIVVGDYVRQLEADRQALIYSSNTVSVWQMP